MILQDLMAQLKTMVEKDPSLLDKRVAVDTEARCDKAHLYEVSAVGYIPPEQCADAVVIFLHI